MINQLRPLDLAALVLTIGGIAAYGMWATRRRATASEFLSGAHQTHWLPMALGILATQASAITFLSTPGQGFEDGLGFAQFYLGMPLALLVLGAWVVPRYMASGARTAYEYLEAIFGPRVRGLAATLFLLSRSLAAGITLYAPAIVLSALFGWNLNATVVVIGVVVIAYTTFGGYKAVEVTQTAQMSVILLGLIAAFVILLRGLPEGFGWSDVWALNSAYGHTQILDFEWNPASRYTVWSGLAGGLFLAMAYFGTDQSQVGRYLSGKSLAEVRRGFLFTGLIKFPMQLFILSLGLLLLARMHFEAEPLWHNPAVAQEWQGMRPDLDAQWAELQAEQHAAAVQPDRPARTERLAALHERRAALKAEAVAEVQRNAPHLETKDQDYVFLGWALNHMPVGLLGLLLAVIMAGAMSSSSAEINALAATSVIDFGRLLGLRETLQASRWITAFWGAAAVGVALLASLYENLIQLVNLVGSLFYGPMLGIFLCAWLLPKRAPMAVFWAGITAELAVLGIHLAGVYGLVDLGYLWYNVIGAVLVAGLVLLLPDRIFRRK
jgi:Na+/proline symporter